VNDPQRVSLETLPQIGSEGKVAWDAKGVSEENVNDFKLSDLSGQREEGVVVGLVEVTKDSMDLELVNGLCDISQGGVVKDPIGGRGADGPDDDRESMDDKEQSIEEEDIADVIKDRDPMLNLWRTIWL
jgi:hypothetical protein